MSSQCAKHLAAAACVLVLLALVSSVEASPNDDKESKRNGGRNNYSGEWTIDINKSIVTHMKTAQETEIVSRRPTGHSVRRFTGTAQMLSGKAPSRATSKESTISESPEPSSTSVKLRKSVLSTIAQHEHED